MEEKKPRAEQAHRSVRILDSIDAFFYMLVGIAFLGAAALTLIYSVINLVAGVAASIPQPSGTTFSLPIAQNVLGFISDLLLVLIILEVLGTIRSYLDKRANSVQPFLFIGIISATRSILSAGAQLSITLSSSGNATFPPHFESDVIQLGISALVIIALGITLRIMGPYATMTIDGEQPVS
ncbi:MAG: phosphate-starvation-inducible PsiE family protein [Ktedonobacterales bacterium]